MLNKKESNSKITKSIILKEDLVDAINNHQSISNCDNVPFSWKVEEMLNIMTSVKSYTELELKNYFTLHEACAICEMLNGTMGSCSLSHKSCLSLNFKDSCSFEDLDSKWGIDKNVLLDKLNNLTEFQAYIVSLMGYSFWSKSDDGNMFDKIKECFNITE